jgi:hypothetical protein
MHALRTLFAAVASVALALTLVPCLDAHACGGYFSVPTQVQSTGVASHRMILSVSQTQSTLYDQVAYSGTPSSFAWVLPTKGMVTVGVSSDALFEEIDALTAVHVQSPVVSVYCPPCTGSAAHTATTTSSSSGGVTVIAQMVVGPYETAQLSSSNPTALTDWLTAHGYGVPTDVAPIITTYVNEGFDFLAVKLVPGTGVSAMVPIRVTTPGASPVLPLRMVAAGAGAKVPITLFVLAEGRYAPTNFPSFTIDPAKLVWDFAAAASNYGTLRDQGFMASNGLGWLVESATPQSGSEVSADISLLAQNNPLQSGYGDAMGNGASQAASDDLATLLTGITPSSLFITRLLAELPKSALSTDLTLGASNDQSVLPTTLIAPTAVHVPTCPPCGTGAGYPYTTGAGGAGAASGGSGGGCNCGIAGTGVTPFAALGAAAALLGAASRRKQRRLDGAEAAYF